MFRVGHPLMPFLLLVGCSESEPDCERAYEEFNGRYVGTAIALENGYLQLTLASTCGLGVDGGYLFHQHVAEVWKEAQYGHDYWRALKVDLSGDIEVYDREFRYHVLVLNEEGKVSSEVTRDQAERAFYDGMRRSIDGEILD